MLGQEARAAVGKKARDKGMLEGHVRWGRGSFGGPGQGH